MASGARIISVIPSARASRPCPMRIRRGLGSRKSAPMTAAIHGTGHHDQPSAPGTAASQTKALASHSGKGPMRPAAIGG